MNRRVELARLHRELRTSIAHSRSAHGAWAVAHRGHDMTLRHHLWMAWKDSVHQSVRISRQIAALEAELKRGATTASLPLARAVAAWEGGRARDGRFHPYQDEVGVWTIGYGHTNADGAPHVDVLTHPLTLSEATTLLLHDINIGYGPKVAATYKQFHWKPNQKMFDATTSFAYNLGPGYFSRGHSMGDAMSTRNVHLVAHAMLLYDKAGGRSLPGLTARRKWEAQLEEGGTYAVHN